MVVLIVERVSPSLRGELTRWMIEPQAGVFVGQVSGTVREKLWEKACGASRGGACVLLHSSNTEQGYMVRTHGKARRRIADFDGLQLVRPPSQYTLEC